MAAHWWISRESDFPPVKTRKQPQEATLVEGRGNKTEQPPLTAPTTPEGKGTINTQWYVELNCAASAIESEAVQFPLGLCLPLTKFRQVHFFGSQLGRQAVFVRRREDSAIELPQAAHQLLA